MTTSENKPGAASIWRTPTGYAATHCRQCAAGWTRIGKEGGVLTVCLLDRERVMADMIDCDRYEPRNLAPSATVPAPATQPVAA